MGSSPEVQRPSDHQFCINADCGCQDWDNRDSLRPLSIFHPDVSSSECIQNHFPERLPCWERKWLQVVLECLCSVRWNRKDKTILSGVYSPTLDKNTLDDHSSVYMPTQNSEQNSRAHSCLYPPCVIRSWSLNLSAAECVRCVTAGVCQCYSLEDDLSFTQSLGSSKLLGLFHTHVLAWFDSVWLGMHSRAGICISITIWLPAWSCVF